MATYVQRAKLMQLCRQRLECTDAARKATTFAKADTKFTSREVIRSSTVASDRGGNERAVRLAKMCGFLKYGTEPHQNMSILGDAWLGWGFVCNFIYACVFRSSQL